MSPGEEHGGEPVGSQATEETIIRLDGAYEQDRGDRTQSLTNCTFEGERFERRGSQLIHSLRLGELCIESHIDSPPPGSGDAKSDWWRAYLAGALPAPAHPGTNARSAIAGDGHLHLNPTTLSGPRRRPMRAVDLFCGSGGLALGLAQLAAELGLRVVTELSRITTPKPYLSMRPTTTPAGVA